MQRLDDVFANASIACVVFDQFAIQGLKLEPPVGLRRAGRLKWCRLYQRVVLEGAGSRLGLGVHAVPNRTALHEDDWMMTIFARDGRGQPEDEPCLGLASHLLEAMGGEMVAFVDDEAPVSNKVRHP